MAGRPAACDTYPYFTGFANETGTGKGLGYNRNYPLPPDTNDELYIRTFGKALDYIARHKVDVLVVSLGFDIIKGDPTGTFHVGPAALGAMGRLLIQAGVPLLIVQEGGYSIRNIKRGSRAFFSSCAEAEHL